MGGAPGKLSLEEPTRPLKKRVSTESSVANSVLKCGLGLPGALAAHAGRAAVPWGPDGRDVVGPGDHDADFRFGRRRAVRCSH